MLRLLVLKPGAAGWWLALLLIAAGLWWFYARGGYQLVAGEVEVRGEAGRTAAAPPAPLASADAPAADLPETGLAATGSAAAGLANAELADEDKPDTGPVGAPSAAAAPRNAGSDGVKKISELLTHSHEGLTPQPLAGGGESIDLRGRFGSAPVARRDSDGRLVIEHYQPGADAEREQ